VGITPPWGLFEQPHAEQRRLLGSIADVGIDHVFIADHVSFRGGDGTDGVVALAALSGLEPRLDLHLGVLLLALRHPMVAARQIATLASAAPGRVTVGVGVGGEDRSEFEVCGIDPATRGRRTDAALEIVRRLLSGEAIDWNDEFFVLEDARIRPTPEPPIAVVVGGRSDAALDRAARLGDGWLAAWCSARRLREGIEHVEAKAAGRSLPPPTEWRHGMQLWVGVGATAEEGRTRVADGMRRFYKMPFEPFERYTPVGTAEQIADFLSPYVDAGARTLNLAPVGADRDVEIETIAEVRRLLT
jgi:alkanesulfonate monooxygenase SsuD/methylene tetrahydromethanopterin reductase-like flavin-dependent oxidoreductase (luciferase family)